MSDLFTLVGRIAIDSENSKAEIDSIAGSAEKLAGTLGTAGTSADKTSKQLGKSGKLGTGSVFLGNLLSGVTEAGIKFLSKLPPAAIQAAASVDAEKAAFQSTFGDMAAAAKESYRQISEETNIFETRLRTAGTKGYAQLKGAGVDANEALSGSEQLLRLAADAAAYYDISLEDADTKIRSFMRGNTEAGDAIGLFTSENQRNTNALEIYGQKWLELSEAQRQFLMLDVAKRIYEDNGVIGQAAREGTEWANVTANMAEAQEQSLATVGSPIKDSLLPALNDLSTWLANGDTQAKLATFAETLGKISGTVFDGLTTAFDWLLNNGEAVGMGLTAISVALVAGAVAAHPYAAAISAVVAGLMWMKSESKGLATGANYDKMFDKFSNEDLQTLQNYVDAVNAAREAEQAYVDSGFGEAEGEKYEAANEKVKSTYEKASAIDDLISTYNSWKSGQAVNQGQDLYLDVPLRASEDSESTMQTEIEGYEFEGEADILASAQSEALIQAALKAMNLQAEVTLKPKLSGFSALLGNLGIPGFATGLDRVPEDNFLARLHKDEAVLTASEAAIWRGEKQPRASAFNRRNTRETSDQPITVNLTVNGNSGSPYEIAGAVRDALEMVRWGV